jgi:hypothetical protein
MAIGAAEIAAQAGTASDPLAVRYEDGRLSVRAEHVPLARALREVARQTGVAISGVSSLSQDVSVTFTGLPLLDGVRRLLGTGSYVLVLEPSSHGAIGRIEVQLAGQGAAPPVDRPRGEDGAEARRRATERLAALGDEDALPHVLAALGDPSPDVRQAAVASLPQYGERALEPVHALLRRERDDGVRMVALQVLAQVSGGTRETVTLLSELLADRDARIRAAVVPALARAGGSRAIEALEMAADDVDPEVRIAALEALARQGSDGTAERVVAQRLADRDPAVRRAAAALLGTFGK